MLTAEQQQKRAQVKGEFDRLINMSVEEMQAHFSSPDSDMASLNPRLSPNSGKALGKRALALKTKEAWEDGDYDEAESVLRPLRWQLSRKVRYADADGKPTLFCTALRNRGHDPIKGGTVHAREGAEKSIGRGLEEIRAAVQDALRLLLPPVVQPDGRMDEPWVWVNTDNIFETYAVAQWEREGVYLSVPYVRIDGEVIVDPAGITEVEPTFVPVHAVTAGDTPEGELTLVAEAVGDDPPKWYGVMIRAGKAKNRSIHNGQPRVYNADMLKAAVAEGKFDGVPAYDRTDSEHLQESGWEKLGEWGKAAWDETKQAVVNTFTWIKNYPKAFDKKIRLALAEGDAKGLPACSITGDVKVTPEAPNVIASIEEVRSCDWISFASAGGTLLAIQESDDNDSHTNTRTQAMKLISVTEALAGHGIKLDPAVAAEYSKTKIQEGAAVDWMIATLKDKTPELFEGDDNMEAQMVKNEALTVKLFKLHMKAATGDAGAPTDPEQKKEPVTEGDEGKQLIEAQRQLVIDNMLEGSGLSAAAQNLVRRHVAGRPFDRTAITEAIREAKDVEAAARGTGGATRVDVAVDAGDKLKNMVHDFFFFNVRDRKDRETVSEAYGITLSKDAPRPITPQNLYRALTGDVNLECDPLKVRVSEAMDTTLATAILVEGMRTRMLYSFRLNPNYQSWQNVVRPVTKMNFKTNEAMADGGFTGYATKTKGQAFATITETGATKETYALILRGGMFNISWEDILNDDVDYMAGLPGRLGDYGARMLSAYMWNIVTSNPTLATDSKAVFHNDHSNLLTDALDETPLTTAIGYLMAQAYPNSTDKMGLTPRTLVTSMSPTQIKKAYELTTAAYGNNNTVADWAQQLGIRPVINPHTADLTDWYLFADPETAPIIEAGFLNGNREPEIQSAMSNGIGDWFTKRDAQFRLEHAYNATWVSYKGAVAGIVAD